jgi:signal peptidase
MAVLVVAGAVLWSHGYRAYAVRTGSMAPTYPTGSLVVDRPVSGDRLRPGTVVTFRVGDELVTHRLVAVGPGGLQTQGDANRSADPWTLQRSDVVGEVVDGASRLGYLVVFLRQPTAGPSLVLLVLSVTLAWQLFFGPTPETGRSRHRGHGPTAGAVALGLLLLVPIGAAAGGSALGVRSTGAWFTDSTPGSLTFEVGCEDTHEQGNGPGNGGGHEKCHGNGHDKDHGAGAGAGVVEVPDEPAVGTPVPDAVPSIVSDASS